MALASFLGVADRAIRSEDGRSLGLMLRLDKAGLPGGGQLVAALLGCRSITESVADIFHPAAADESRRLWHGVFTEHLSAVADTARGSEDSAYTHAHAALSPLQLLMREADTNWLMAPLHAVIADVRSLSVAMERRLVAQGHRHDALARISELTTTLRDAFSYTINHRIPREKMPLVRRNWGADGVSAFTPILPAALPPCSRRSGRHSTSSTRSSACTSS